MSMRTEVMRMLGCFVCLLALLSVATATETTESLSTESSSTDFAAVRDECADNISRLKGQLAGKKEAGAADSVPLLDELALWRQIELVVSQRQAVFDARQLAPPPNEPSVANDGKISGFLERERARDTLAVTRGNLEVLQRELQAEHSMMQETKDLLHRAEQDRRRATENLLSASANSRPTFQNRQRLDALSVRLHQQQLALHRDTIAEMTERQDRIESIIAIHSDRIEQAGSGIRLTKGELEQQLAKLSEMENVVGGQLANLDQRMRLILVTSSDQQHSAAASSLEVIREESQLLRQLLSEIAAIRECWNRRFRFSNEDVSMDQWIIWRDDARQAENRLSEIDSRLANRTMLRRQQVVAIGRQSAGGVPQSEDAAAELAEIEAIIDAYGNLQMLAASGRRTYIRFAEDLEARQGQNSIRLWTSRAGNRLRACWDYEVTAVDDRSITIGKLVLAFLLLIVGLIISKAVSSIVAFRVLPRFGFSHAAATTIRQMMMYGLVVAMTMLSLKMVNVPLAIFAFLGGAAAIGVGFGSQNTVANFISGLILLLQRPIRIGDLVNVDGIDANVEHIGTRATRVRTSENLEVLIPNHNILQNKVTNWTLSDTRIRTCVTVGVAYGTEVKPVIETLRRVVTRHPKVLAETDPIVLFEDFGDSSLVFRVHFWIHMRTIMDGHEVRSDIRVAIDDAFRRAGIVIAFPQRDVHLDLQSPIEVSLSESQRSISRRPRRAA